MKKNTLKQKNIYRQILKFNTDNIFFDVNVNQKQRIKVVSKYNFQFHLDNVLPMK